MYIFLPEWPHCLPNSNINVSKYLYELILYVTRNLDVLIHFNIYRVCLPSWLLFNLLRFTRLGKGSYRLWLRSCRISSSWRSSFPNALYLQCYIYLAYCHFRRWFFRIQNGPRSLLQCPAQFFPYARSNHKPHQVYTFPVLSSGNSLYSLSQSALAHPRNSNCSSCARPSCHDPIPSFNSQPISSDTVLHPRVSSHNRR